jgi:zinc protease
MKSNAITINAVTLEMKAFVLALLIALVFIFNCTPLWAIDATRKVLPKGIIVLHSEQRNLPLVKVTLLIKASPFNEPPEKAGLANLVSELLMEGTKTRTSEQISEEVEFIGAEVTISTDNDYTMINLSVLKKDIAKGFEIFSDILINPTFPEAEIKRKKGLIKGALQQMEESPDYVAMRKFRETIYGQHPYGRSIEGTPETLDSIKKEDIITFYGTYYRPNNAIVSIVGDMSYEESITLVNRYLSKWEEGTIPEEKISVIPDLKRTTLMTVDRELTQANIVLGHLGIKRSNPDYYAVSVMNYILGGGGFASRLMERIRDDMGLAYDVHSFFTSDRDRGVFQVGVQTKNESAKKVIDVIVEEIRRIQKEPVSDEELKDAKAYLTGSFPRRLDTMSKIAHFLTLTEFYNLGMDYDKRYPEYIHSVTKDDVLVVSRKYLHPEKYVIVIVADSKKTGISKGSQ